MIWEEPTQLDKNKKVVKSTGKGAKRHVKIYGPDKVRKHQGVYQSGPKKGQLKGGYKYSGKKTKTGLMEIVKTNKVKLGAVATQTEEAKKDVVTETKDDVKTDMKRKDSHEIPAEYQINDDLSQEFDNMVVDDVKGVNIR